MIEHKNGIKLFKIEAAKEKFWILKKLRVILMRQKFVEKLKKKKLWKEKKQK